jgi:hypothetical protein
MIALLPGLRACERLRTYRIVHEHRILTDIAVHANRYAMRGLKA